MHVYLRISTSYNLGDLKYIKKYTPTRKPLYHHMTSLDPTSPSLKIVTSVLRFGRACSLPEKLPSVFFPSTGKATLGKKIGFLLLKSHENKYCQTLIAF